MNLGLSYTHRTRIGYGRMGVKLHEALVRAGVNVYDDLGLPDDVLGDERAIAAHREESKGWTSGMAKDVVWATVPAHVPGRWRGQRCHIFTMWEATRIPVAFRENLAWFDSVIVPSAQNVEIFSEYHDNVNLVPLGIDKDEWFYIPRHSPEIELRFLCGGSGVRKGTDLTVKAFHTVFPDPGSMRPVPRLVMKSPRGEGYQSDYVTVVAGYLDDATERQLYADCHVYVQPSRGEGFGLQPLQAMAQGMPTILSDAHGHAGFAHLGIPIAAPESPVTAEFLWGDPSDWWEPDFDELCEAMWETYVDYARHKDRAAKNALEVAAHWSWDNTAARLIDVLPDLNEPAPPRVEWENTERRLFHVRVNKGWKADIAGIMYQFHPGVDYYEPADVKRILFVADVLDPSCMEGPDHGLSPAQAARLGDYSARHSKCEMCGQPLPDESSEADDLDALYEELIAKAGA